MHFTIWYLSLCIIFISLLTGVECSKPPPFSNGVVSGHGNRYPTILTHICYKGYLRKGGKNVKCMASGNWSAPFPTCESKFQIFFCFENHINYIYLGYPS